MAKAKDPAFLFYSQWWIEGTSEFSPAEKGVYIDLLAHQHQKGSIPSDIKLLCRISRLPENELLPIWDVIKTKFQPIGNQIGNQVGNQNGYRLINQKLTEVTIKRNTKSVTNTISGTFAAIVRNNGHLPKEQIQHIKKLFSTRELQRLVTKTVTNSETKTVTQLVQEWFDKCLKSIINNNINNTVLLSNNIETAKTDFFDKVLAEKKNNFWNQKPNAEDVGDLPEINVGGVIQLFKIGKYTEISADQVKSYWEIFKIITLQGNKYYQYKEDVYTHFVNWINLKKIENGKIKLNKDDRSVGAVSQAKLDAIKNWGEDLDD